MYPKSRYATDGVCFESHVISWQYALHESVELSAGFLSWSRAFAGTDHGAHRGGDHCVFGIERMDLGQFGSSIFAFELVPALRSEGILALTAVRVDPNQVAEVIQAAGSRPAPAAIANAAHGRVNLVVDGW